MTFQQTICEELIGWDGEKTKQFKGVMPKAKYSAASEAVRHSVSEATACSMFCKGQNCKYENVTNWKKDEMEIEGLYSNWITKNILAMARPNTKNIKEYKIIEQFKQHGITSIINLQLPGEHASCGYGLEAGGFSYDQQFFMDNDIFFYNFGWEDYGVGSLENILDMVKVMQFAISQGKVAVHCHAGLGRTCVLIACYLIYVNRIDPKEVVHYIRSIRPPSIQTQGQINCIEEFSQYLKPYRVVFSFSDSSDPATNEFTLAQFLTRQKHILHGVEARTLKYVPKIIYECCEQLLRLAGRSPIKSHKQDEYEDVVKTAPLAFITSRQSFSSKNEPSLSVKLAKAKIISIESFTALSLQKKDSKASFGVSYDSLNSTDDLSRSESLSSTSDITPASSHQNISARFDEHNNGGNTLTSVAIAMSLTEYDDKTIQAAESLKNLINNKSEGYESLREVTDPRIPAKLMWDWLDNLKEPVLHAQDLPSVLQYSTYPMEGLKLLNKGARYTTELIFWTIALLEPLGDDIERDLVQRVLSTLTHQNMVIEMEILMSSDKNILKRTSSDMGLMRSNVAAKLMHFFMHLLFLMQKELSVVE